MAKSFIRWVGGKSNLLSQLVDFVPNDYNRYVEPFVGGGALFFHLEPEHAIISDINEELINLYIVIRDNVDELIHELKQHVNDELYYYQYREQDRTKSYITWSPVKKASRMLYLNKTCWNGVYRVNSNGFFNVPFGYRKNPNIVDEDTLRTCSKVLQKATIGVSSFENIVGSFVTEKDFVYLDPPYVPLNETSFTSYSKEDFNEEDQLNLKKTCDEINKRGAYFMLSNSYVKFILDLYKNYDIHIVQAPRFVNRDGNNRGNVKEVVVVNYKVEPKQTVLGFVESLM